MRKHLILTSISIIVVILIVSGVAIFGAYHLGVKQQDDIVSELQIKLDNKEKQYEKSLSGVIQERNKAINDYEASCSEYLKLRTSYEQLYKKSGIASGFMKYTSPDDARGNDESCYR